MIFKPKDAEENFGEMRLVGPSVNEYWTATQLVLRMPFEHKLPNDDDPVVEFQLYHRNLNGEYGILSVLMELDDDDESYFVDQIDDILDDPNDSEDLDMLDILRGWLVVRDFYEY